MGIQLTTNNQFPATINYGTSGVYTGDVSFSTNGLGLSAVSAVNITAMTLGLSTLGIPNVSFSVSGAALPRTLVVTAGTSESLLYTITANNNYLHASTVYANVTSSLVAAAVLSGSATIGAETSAYSGTAFNSGILTLNGDAGAPDPITSFVAIGGDKSIALTWTNPAADWSTVTISQLDTLALSAVGQGTTVYTATAASMSAVTVAVPVIGTELYYFSGYATDNVGKNSTVVTTTPLASAVPVWGLWSSAIEHGRLCDEGYI